MKCALISLWLHHLNNASLTVCFSFDVWKQYTSHAWDSVWLDACVLHIGWVWWSTLDYWCIWWVRWARGGYLYTFVVARATPTSESATPMHATVTPTWKRAICRLKGPSFDLRRPSLILIVPCAGLKGPRFCLRRAFPGRRRAVSGRRSALSGRQRLSFCPERALFLPLSALFDVDHALTWEALASRGGPFVGLKRLSFNVKEGPLSAWKVLVLAWNAPVLAWEGPSRSTKGPFEPTKGPLFGFKGHLSAWESLVLAWEALCPPERALCRPRRTFFWSECPFEA